MDESREVFQFYNLADLRDWLNNFENTDLSVVLPGDSCDHFQVVWVQRALTDGSRVTDAIIDTHNAR